MSHSYALRLPTALRITLTIPLILPGGEWKNPAFYMGYIGILQRLQNIAEMFESCDYHNWAHETARYLVRKGICARAHISRYLAFAGDEHLAKMVGRQMWRFSDYRISDDLFMCLQNGHHHLVPIIVKYVKSGYADILYTIARFGNTYSVNTLSKKLDIERVRRMITDAAYVGNIEVIIAVTERWKLDLVIVMDRIQSAMRPFTLNSVDLRWNEYVQRRGRPELIIQSK